MSRRVKSYEEVRSAIVEEGESNLASCGRQTAQIQSSFGRPIDLAQLSKGKTSARSPPLR